MTLCSRCGLPAHRYSPDHEGSGTDWYGCVNSLRGRIQGLEAVVDAAREVVLSARAIAAVPPHYNHRIRSLEFRLLRDALSRLDSGGAS